MQLWLHFIILVMPSRACWLIYPPSTQMPSAHALWPAAGTGHLGHKVNTSSSQKTQQSPCSLRWVSLEAWSAGVAGCRGSAVLKSLCSCPAVSAAPGQLMRAQSILSLMVLGSHRASLETLMTQSCMTLGDSELLLCYIQGAGGSWTVAVNWTLSPEILVNFPQTGWGGKVSEEGN